MCITKKKVTFSTEIQKHSENILQFIFLDIKLLVKKIETVPEGCWEGLKEILEERCCHPNDC